MEEDKIVWWNVPHEHYYFNLCGGVPDNRCVFQTWLLRQKGTCIDKEYKPKMLAIGFASFIFHRLLECVKSKDNVFGVKCDVPNVDGSVYSEYFEKSLNNYLSSVPGYLQYGDWKQKRENDFLFEHIEKEEAYWQESCVFPDCGCKYDEMADLIRNYTETYLNWLQSKVDAECGVNDSTEAEKSVRAKIEGIYDKAKSQGLMDRNGENYLWHCSDSLLAYLMGRLFLGDEIQHRYWIKGEQQMAKGYWSVIGNLFNIEGSKIQNALKDAKNKNTIPKGYKKVDSCF